MTLVVWLKKTDYNTKITEIEKKLTDYDHNKYITTPEFNAVAASVFNARLVQVNLITKTDDVKLSSLNRKITANKSKHLLVENELKKLKESALLIFVGNLAFDGSDGSQAYLIFQPLQRYF